MSTLIHLHVPPPPNAPPGQTNWSTACGTATPAQGTTLTQFNHQMTGDPRAVNCPACKNSPKFKEAMS